MCTVLGFCRNKNRCWLKSWKTFIFCHNASNKFIGVFTVNVGGKDYGVEALVILDEINDIFFKLFFSIRELTLF